MRDVAVGDGLHFLAAGSILDRYDVEWHEADLGGTIAAILMVHDGVVYCEVERRLLASPTAWMIRPWAARHVFADWTIAVATMDQFRAATG